MPTDGHVVLLKYISDRFNARDIDAVLAVVADDIAWANGMDGGHVHGRDALRGYWTKQWSLIQPQVDPVRITNRGDGTTAVEVHQVVRDLEGKPLLDEVVRHVFRIQGDRITRFDIEKAGGLSSIPQA